MLRNLVKTLFSRAVALGISSIASFLTARLLLSDASSTSSYSLYILLIGLPALLPFVDLGTGAAIVNSVAESPSPTTDSNVRNTVKTAVRVTALSGCIIAGSSIALYCFGLWPTVLGQAVRVPGGEATATISLILFGISVPLGVSLRILLGLSRYHIVLLVQAAQGPVTLLYAFFVVNISPFPIASVSIGYFLALMAAGAAGLVAVGRSAGYGILPDFRSIWIRSGHSHQSVIAQAKPMLVQLLVVPIGVYSGRLLLSHLSNAQQLAEYGISATVFGALMSLVTAVGTGLWPHFAKARKAGAHGSPFRIASGFLASSLVGCGLVAILSSPIYSLISGGKLRVALLVTVSFTMQVVVQAALYPLGMYLTDLAGLKYQVIPTVLMAAVSIGLCALLIPPIGAAAPALATAVAVFSCQLVPYALEVRRRTRTSLVPG